MKHFTPEQIKELSEIFGIKPKEFLDRLPISDGYASKDDMVWWKCDDGPEKAKAMDHWANIASYPHLYSFAEPQYKIVYK